MFRHPGETEKEFRDRTENHVEAVNLWEAMRQGHDDDPRWRQAFRHLVMGGKDEE